MRQQDELAVRFAADASAEGWLKRDVAVLAAVSGGPDSMALLHLLKTLAEHTPMRIVVAHANHQFRGAESDAEEALVRGVARDWGLPFEAAALNVPAYIEETGMNAQTAAREKRYIFLREVASRHGCSYAMFGHHADDQAETVLMRIIRGTGPGGLAGIPHRRREEEMELIRPLVRITKGELLAYCKRNGVPYAVDSSNVDRHYFRNAVRLDVMPMLETFNPRLKASLARLAELAAADDAYMEAETLQAFRLGVTADGEGYRVGRRRFRGLHVALQRRLVKLILSCSEGLERQFDYRLVEDIVSVVTPELPAATRMELGGGWELVREYDEVYIGPIRPNPASYCYPIDTDTDAVLVGETGERFAIERLQGAAKSSGDRSAEACFDEEELVYPLRIRSRTPGDVMEPHGLNGSKKVQDMFVDAKVPRYLRDRMPLLVDGEGRVLWIPGLRRSRHALIGEGTRKTLRIAIEHPEN
ncbi:tRNA lysidine(34) synthetase TilS [Cohnella sp. GCM10027633]|uniref:tRNA lysidine(34) synthetase TilS n=1 Tax=unclassified Cohnella TaxID=2636738 RepID=UPI0036298467